MNKYNNDDVISVNLSKPFFIGYRKGRKDSFEDYTKRTAKLLYDTRKKFGIEKCNVMKCALVAAWVSNIKPHSDYIPYVDVLSRNEHVMQKKEYVPWETILSLNWISYMPQTKFFGVIKKTILTGNITQTLKEAIEYYNDK